jgi:type IV secretion system protein TrbI
VVAAPASVDPAAPAATHQPLGLERLDAGVTKPLALGVEQLAPRTANAIGCERLLEGLRLEQHRQPGQRPLADPPRVMRLSRKALGVMGVGAGIAIGGALIYALQPTSHTASRELYNTHGHPTAEALASAPKDYGQVPKLGPPLPGDLGGPILSAQARGETVPVPPIGAGQGQAGGRSTAETAAETARQRVREERDAARTSRLFLSGGAAAAERGASVTDADAAPKVASAQSSADLSASQPAPGGNGPRSKRDFLNASVDRRTLASDQLNDPPSPYVLQAGSVIAAALITGVGSDLPGQVTAQVTQNVYDSPTGRILLVPQGARLIGDYDDQVGYGQQRVLLVWTRLILPDGRSVVLERQPAGDAAGNAGLEDGVNNHLGNLARAAGLSTLLSFGAQLASDSQGDLVRALREGGQQTVNQAGQEIVRRQLSVPPTLTIRPGFPVRVLVTRDLVLAPIARPR